MLRQCRILLVVGIALAAGCKNSSTTPTGPSTPPPTVASFIASAGGGAGDATIAATRQAGTPPAASNGPLVTVTTPSTSALAAIAGNTTLFVAQSSAAFKTVYVSIGPVTVAGSSNEGRRPRARLARLADLLQVKLLAATAQPADYFQIDLPAAVTILPIAVTYAASFPTTGFNVQFQIVGTTGAVGPVTSVFRNASTPALELVGVVFGKFTGIGSVFPPDPIAGAIVSTTLDGRSAVTDANGLFDLQTSVTSSACYNFTIFAFNWPTYSAVRKGGNNALVAYTLGSQPQLPVAPVCN